jgi:hypothetical protein
VTKPTKFYEILAVERDRATAAETLSTESMNTFSKKPHLFRGKVQDVTYLNAEREGENTHASETVSDTVQGNLDYLKEFLGKHWDTFLAKEMGNTVAFADVVLDGVTIVTHVPSTWLLGMEARLARFRAVLLAIPTLDPALHWEADPAQGRGIFRAETPVRFKTEKTKDFKVIVPPTDKHPAQVAEVITDNTVARIEETAFSGMVTPVRKAELITRLDALIGAVQQARQRANDVVLDERKVSPDIFGYLFAE